MKITDIKSTKNYSIVESLSIEAEWIRNRARSLFMARSIAMDLSLRKRIEEEFHKLSLRKNQILKSAISIRESSDGKNISSNLLIEICKRSIREFQIS